MRRTLLKRFTIFVTISFLCQSSSFAYNYHLPIDRYTLSNGLTVILEEDRSSRLVTIQLWIRTGSCYEGKFLGSGITHLVEHMVFKRENSGSSIRIAKELQELGGELDASTSKEYTQFNITIQKDNLEKAMRLVYGVITEADFIQEELDKEKEIVIHEMDTIRDDPDKLLAEEFFKFSFQGHPYGEPVIGNKQLFQSITRENIMEYYKSQYTPKNMVLIVAGNFNSAVLKPLVNRLWGQIPEVFSEPNYIPNRPSVQGPVSKKILKDIESSYIAMGFYGPSIDSEDIYPMDVLAEIAGGGKNSRLVKKIRDKLGLVSSISAWSYTPTFTGIWGVSADLITSDWGLTVKNILKELYKFKLDLVAEKELLRAKKRIMRMYLSGLETINGRANDLGSNEIYTRNPLFSTTYIKGIRNVTKDSIIKVAGKYFKQQNFIITALIPPTRSEAELTGQPKAGARQGAETWTEEKEITRLELDNGMRILLKEDRRLPLVTVRLAALGGLLEEDIPGLSYFFSQIWLKENPDLVKDIEAVGGSISTYSGYNSLGCTIEVFKEDIPLALNVIKKLLQQFPDTLAKMELVKNILLAEIKQEEDTPYGFTFKQCKEVFFDAHPYRNSILGNKEAVNRIKEADIRDFFNKYLAPDNMVLSIFGDINTQELTSLVNILNSPPIKEKLRPKEQNPLTPKVNEKTIPREMEQAIILLAYPCVSIYSEDRYAIELLTQIFSGQAGRLYETMREEKALSYNIGAINLIGREPGSFIFYIATSPGNVEGAKDYLFNEVSKIKSEGVSEEELDRVKKYYITQTQESWEGISGLSLETTLDELYGLGWDYYKKYIENIEKVTTENIKSSANKYFRDDWYTLIVVGPVKEQKSEAKSE